MARRKGTDGSLLATLPWTLAAIAFSIAPHVQYLPVWVTVSFVGCAAWRWQIERKRWRLPAAWARIGLSLVCFLGIIATYGAVSGVGPGSALLAIMAALKLLETRKRRDQFVLLFISVFLIMASLLREQYLWSLPYLIVGVLVTMTAWLRMSTTRPVSIRASFAIGGRLVVYALPLMLAMWIFFPRISTPFWAVPIDTSSAVSGLSDSMSPGDISSLSLSNEVAFRVKFDGAVPPPRQRYWRGLVLYQFNGRTWTGREPGRMPRVQDDIKVLGEPVRYEVTLEPTRQHYAFALDVPTNWSLARTHMGPQQQLTRVQPIDQRVAYRATSYPSYSIQPNMSRTSLQWYTRLPDNSNPRTIELARNMRAVAGSDEEFIRAVLSKFHNEDFYYTLEPPPLGDNPVDRFLFETRRGFCEHYASAFSVLVRAVNIPSRIVLGYQGGEVNPMGQYLIVRQADAHAWTEVWLEHKGWTRVDPTGAVAPERIEVGRSGAMFDGIGASWGLNAPAQWLYNLTLTWDALNARWNDWILGYGPENQDLFMRWLGMDEPDWRQMILTLLAVVAAIIVGISFLLVLRYKPPSKDPAAILYRRFTRKTGVEPHRGETPQSFAGRLNEQDSNRKPAIDQVTASYLAARYGPPNPHALQDLQSAVSNFSSG